MEKEEIFVSIDTDEKAKEVAQMLIESGENVFPDSLQGLIFGADEMHKSLVFSNSKWVRAWSPINRQKISIEQFKNLIMKKPKCYVLGQNEPKQKEFKPIELEWFLMDSCEDFNQNMKKGHDFLRNESYTEIKLVPVEGYDKDIIIATKPNGDEILFFGKWNDGVA